MSTDGGVRWRGLPAPTGLTGGMDGSLSLANGQPVVLYDCTDWAGCHPTTNTATTAAAAAAAAAAGVEVGDPPIVGIARPANLSDPLLTNWTRDPTNPIVITDPNGTVVSAGYAGPSNLWDDNPNSAAAATAADVKDPDPRPRPGCFYPPSLPYLPHRLRQQTGSLAYSSPADVGVGCLGSLATTDRSCNPVSSLTPCPLVSLSALALTFALALALLQGPHHSGTGAAAVLSMTMIYGSNTGLFRTTTAGGLHNWTLVNPVLYPGRGGGGGLFFPLPSAPPSRSRSRPLPGWDPAPPGGVDPTHMLQVDAPGHPDGVAAFVVGRHDPATGSFTVAGAPGNATLHFLDGDGLLFTQFHATPIPTAVASDDGKMTTATRAAAGGGTRLRYVGWMAPARAISVVHELWWDPMAGRFASGPAPELTGLRSAAPLSSHHGVAVPGGSTFAVLGAGGDTADVELQVRGVVATASVGGVGENTAGSFSIGVLGGAHRDSAGRTGLVFTVSVSVSGANRSAVTVAGDCSKPAHGKLTPVHCVTCPDTPFTLTPGEAGRLDVRILIDRTAVELFVGGGRAVCTGSLARVPSEANTGVYVENAAGMAPLTIANATVWGMGCGL